MRADDPADSTRYAEIMTRVEEVERRLEDSKRRGKQRRKLVGKVRHKASLIADESDSSEDTWRQLAAIVDELIEDGMQPSNRELRDLLAPIIDHLPDLDEVPRGFELVLREIDRFMATCPPPKSNNNHHPAPPTPEVQEVARLLQGRAMVLIGGERRPASDQALKEAFRLEELVWIEAREHQSISTFEPAISRPEVAVVLLAIRWSSHSFGEVREFCEQYGKHLVRLPGGYNPNQVAAQIMTQCSERLKAE